ncbi:MAG TPA: hypothetical protein VHQ65_08415 [Thermoanaerobaculia bacterium]|nr:hypothetical protein [Thermoanaerobaculia bacterium]
MHAPSGEVVAVLPVPQDLAAVDADREWGVAALALGGRELRWARPGGEVARLALPDEAADVAWISADEVAVSPVASRHRVEIWNLARGARMAAFGEEEPVAVPEAGVYLVRSVLLEHDAERNRLWTQDSFTGDIQVFDAEGRRVARAQVDNPRRRDLEAALRTSDAAARREGRTSPARYLILRLALDERGTGYVVTACGDDRRSAHLTELPADGGLRQRRISLGAACCTRVFTVTDGWLVLYDSSSVPGPGCTTVEPLQDASSSTSRTQPREGLE